MSNEKPDYKELETQLSECNALLDECEIIINDVAHIGVDFGYGEYELDKKQIGDSRELVNKLKNRKRA